MGILHFVILALVPLGAALAVALGRRSGMSATRAVVALAIVPLPWLLWPGHLCGRGSPSVHLAVAALALSLPLAFVSELRRAVLASVGLALPVFLAAANYDSIVHRPEWTGNPDWEERRLAVKTDTFRRALRSQTVRIAGGWLDEAAILKEFLPGDFRAERVDAVAEWHTWLTRLWRRKVTPVRLWSPGGSAAEAVAGLEWR